MGELSVNPATVHESGVELQRAAQTLHSELSASDEQIAASHTGWVGQSAQALASKAAEWRDATQIHHDNLTDHGEKFMKAASHYSGVDDSAADELKQAGSAFGSDSSGAR